MSPEGSDTRLVGRERYCSHRTGMSDVGQDVPKSSWYRRSARWGPSSTVAHLGRRIAAPPKNVKQFRRGTLRNPCCCLYFRAGNELPSLEPQPPSSRGVASTRGRSRSHTAPRGALPPPRRTDPDKHSLGPKYASCFRVFFPLAELLAPGRGFP